MHRCIDFLHLAVKKGQAPRDCSSQSAISMTGAHFLPRQLNTLSSGLMSRERHIGLSERVD